MDARRAPHPSHRPSPRANLAAPREAHRREPNAFVGAPSFQPSRLLAAVCCLPPKGLDSVFAGGVTLGCAASTFVRRATDRFVVEPGDWLRPPPLRRTTHHDREGVNWGVCAGFRTACSARRRRERAADARSATTKRPGEAARPQISLRVSGAISSASSDGPPGRGGNGGDRPGPWPSDGNDRPGPATSRGRSLRRPG